MTLLLLYQAPALTIAPGLYTNTQAFPNPTGAVGSTTLAAGLYTNTQTFFAPTVLKTIAVPLFVNTQDFFAGPTLTQPGQIANFLYTNTQEFFAPTLARGAVTLAPSLYTNTQTFQTPTVALLLSQSLNPGLFTNSQTFFAPTVINTRQFISPALHVNAQQFFPPFLTNSYQDYYGIGHYLEALREAEEERQRKLGIISTKTRRVDSRMEEIDRLEQSLAGPARPRQAINVSRYVGMAKKMDEIAELEKQIERGQIK